MKHEPRFAKFGKVAVSENTYLTNSVSHKVLLG